MRRTSLLDQHEDETEINLSSMIDCIFILLIFFIVTTVFVEEKGIQVAKPDAAAATSMEESENVIFEINAENRVFFDGREIPVAEVATRVKAGMKDEETPVVIRVSEKADHGSFVAVWDAARSAGAESLSFNTVQ
jgi:biopolymer transport protein ExbD